MLTCRRPYRPDPDFDPVMSRANEDPLLDLEDSRPPRARRVSQVSARVYGPDPDFDPVMSRANEELIK